MNEADRARSYPYADAPRLPEAEQVDPRQVVGDATSPIELEIGPGRGGFIWERLHSDPSVRIIGLEIRRKWATIMDRKLQGAGLGSRGRVFAEDAKLALPRFPDACISRAYVHFPDPWWKKRHAKRLVAQQELVAQMERLLIDGGEFFVQTDVEERANLYQTLFDGSALMQAWPGGPRVADPGFGARSPRERRAMSDGLPIVRLRYLRRARVPAA